MALPPPSVAAWAGDPAWASMDATARGFHAQLLLMAAQRRPAGTLPADDKTWRKWLGVPSASCVPPAALADPALARALLKSAQGEAIVAALGPWWVAVGETPAPATAHMGLDGWMAHLWVHRWRPMLETAWRRIDADLLAERPDLSGAEGGWFHPVAEALALGAAPATLPVAKAKRSVVPRTKKGMAPVLLQANATGLDGEAANDGLMAVGGDRGGWRDRDQVLLRWRVPLERSAQHALWEVGVACLTGTGASPSEKQQARGMIGKLIKLHGEEAVAAAVGTLSMRPLPPADAVAFLQGVLRTSEEGSEAEQKARSKRARVAL